MTFCYNLCFSCFVNSTGLGLFISEEKQSEINVKTGLNSFLNFFWDVLG